MAYRHYDTEQYLNKIQVLEEKIVELETENAQLKEKLRISVCTNANEVKHTQAVETLKRLWSIIQSFS